MSVEQLRQRGDVLFRRKEDGKVGVPGAVEDMRKPNRRLAADVAPPAVWGFDLTVGEALL